jgi:hypothetical protein
MKKCLEEGMLPTPFYFIGDEAFVCSTQFLVPWSGHGLDAWKDSFNFHLSVMRQCIERAFALLTQRWGIFWRPLRCSFDKWTLVASVAAKLHNYCIDMGEGTSADIAQRMNEDHVEHDSPVMFMNEDREEGGGVRGRPTGETRQNLTASLQSQGFRRPNHAAINSRE